MSDPWYKEGLRFGCTQCGACCTGGPGYVWLSEEDIENLCQTLKLPREEFLKRYARKVFTRYALREDAKNYDCVFLKGKKCEVYTSRPKQCRTFPWWKEHLTNPEAWKEAGSYCEGIDHPDGEVVPASEIDRHL